MFRRNFIMLLCLLMILSVGGVYAVWQYASGGVNPEQKDILLSLNEFDYTEPEIPMPDGEISLLERLRQILNREYTTDNITDSREYLLNETILVEWEPYAAPYVGSMDPDYQTQMDELFGDIVQPAGISFILKSQDLNWDGYPEIALYSTSDPLDWTADHYAYVGVYLSVFTPIIDTDGTVIRYDLLCDSIYGHCTEINYHGTSTIPSFTTDSWKDSLYYWHGADYVPLPEHARHTYEIYHSCHYMYDGAPYPMWIDLTGQTASQRLADAFAALQ